MKGEAFLHSRQNKTFKKHIRTSKNIKDVTFQRQVKHSHFLLYYQVKCNMVGTLEFMSPEVGFNPFLFENYYCTTHMQGVKY
jgi:hypothetical protein